jgi:hypothetical protein
MKLVHFLPILFLVFCLVSCQSKQEYQGDSMVNYPDMGVLLEQNLKPYEKEPYSYRKVVIEGKQRDTTFLKAKDIDWKTIETLFNKASLFDKQYDKQYKINVLEDTIASTLTVMYNSLNPKNPTSTLNIKATQDNSQVLSIYAEVSEEGFFHSESYKLLYVNKRTIQIQEAIKKPFSSLKQKVTTYSFLN